MIKLIRFKFPTRSDHLEKDKTLVKIGTEHKQKKFHRFQTFPFLGL